MKKSSFYMVGVSLFMSLFLLAACETQNETIASSTINTTFTGSSDLPVTAEGRIVPDEDYTLAFEDDGTIIKIDVDEGDLVQYEDVLVELGSTVSLEAQQASLNFELIQAQQELEDLYENAELDREETWQTVIEAQETYDAAEEEYNDLESQDNYDDDIEEAEVDIREAQKEVDDAEEDLYRYKDLDIDNSTRKRYEDILDVANEKLDEKQHAKNEIENERGRIVSEFYAAEASLQMAQSEYNKRINGPDSDMVTLLSAQINSINAQLASVEDQLNKMKLTAPINGEVVKVNYNEHEFVQRGDPVIIIADTTKWYVESTDLTELEVAKLSVGQAVIMEADAFPGETFTGKIERISSYSRV